MANGHPAKSEHVEIPAQWASLGATLELPQGVEEMALIPHGSAKFNIAMAEALERHGIGRLALELLTEEEIAVPRIAFDLHLLARLLKVRRWLRERRQTCASPVGIFATGTDAAVALIAAASEPAQFSAIVSFNGRPELALYSLTRVETPTLFIVRARDPMLARLNRQGYSRLAGEKRMLIRHPPSVRRERD